MFGYYHWSIGPTQFAHVNRWRIIERPCRGVSHDEHSLSDRRDRGSHAWLVHGPSCRADRPLDSSTSFWGEVDRERRIPPNMWVHVPRVCARPGDVVVPHAVGPLIAGGAGARPPTRPRRVRELRVSHAKAENRRLRVWCPTACILPGGPISRESSIGERTLEACPTDDARVNSSTGTVYPRGTGFRYDSRARRAHRGHRRASTWTPGVLAVLIGARSTGV